MNEINVPLLRKAVEWVEEQDALLEAGAEAEWYQGFWFSGGQTTRLGATDHLNPSCGTAKCLAGYVATLVDSDFAALRVPPGQREWTANGKDVREVARDALGIDFEQGQALFDATNDAATIREIAEKFAGGAL